MDKKWWHVLIEYAALTDDENTKVKKIKEEHFVQAVSPTDVEVIVTKEMTEYGVSEFEFKSLKPTKVIKILTADGELTS